MSKPYRWTGKTALGSTINSEAHSEEDARSRAESMGCTEFHCEENPEFSDSEAIEAVSPEAPGQSAADNTAKDKSDLQVLGEANATMFRQLDGLKNQIASLEMERDQSNSAFSTIRALHEKALDAKALILAWNSEQQAHAAAENREYQEPAFMEHVRAIT